MPKLLQLVVAKSSSALYQLDENILRSEGAVLVEGLGFVASIDLKRNVDDAVEEINKVSGKKYLFFFWARVKKGRKREKLSD